MIEFGLFNDEGCVERQFYTRRDAEEARDTRYEPEDELTVHELCPDHEEQPKISCEECGL